MSEEKSSKDKNLNEDLALGIGITALSIGAGALGYKITEFLSSTFRTNPYTKHPSYKKIAKIISKESSIEMKLEKLKEKIDSNDWFDQLGAILCSFSEFEMFLDALIIKMNSKKNPLVKLQKKKKLPGLLDKLGRIKGIRLIDNMEFVLLKNLIGTRNQLVHGEYDEIDIVDIRACFTVISDFLLKYYYKNTQKQT